MGIKGQFPPNEKWMPEALKKIEREGLIFFPDLHPPYKSCFVCCQEKEIYWKLNKVFMRNSSV